jgi:hypothetical protein
VRIGYQHLTTKNKVPRSAVVLEIVERGE